MMQQQLHIIDEKKERKVEQNRTTVDTHKQIDRCIIRGGYNIYWARTCHRQVRVTFEREEENARAITGWGYVI